MRACNVFFLIVVKKSHTHTVNFIFEFNFQKTTKKVSVNFFLVYFVYKWSLIHKNYRRCWFFFCHIFLFYLTIRSKYIAHICKFTCARYHRQFLEYWLTTPLYNFIKFILDSFLLLMRVPRHFSTLFYFGVFFSLLYFVFFLFLWCAYFFLQTKTLFNISINKFVS